MAQPQISQETKEKMETQGYRIVGTHSLVKPCGWTKKIINDEGTCYKHKFYGINAAQCLQMSTSLSCANRCIFCWRDYKAPVATKWTWEIDDPKQIIDDAIKAQEKLLIGYKGSDKANKKIYELSTNIKHVALSLTGEPITYPRINELIKEFHKRKISTFLVTNGQYPEHLKNMQEVTQLYISVDGTTPENLKKVGVPLFKDYWERLIKSLDIMAKKVDRTCIRITAIKEMNMQNAKGYADMIIRGNPDFVEVKGYMFVGASRQRLDLKNMPRHEQVKEFAQDILSRLPDYEYVSEHMPSRVILLVKKTFNKDTQIRFEEFFQRVNKA